MASLKIALGLLIVGSLTISWQNAPSARGALLSGAEARRLFRPCSRQAPQNVSGYWTPDAADIVKLESRWNHLSNLKRAYADGGRTHKLPDTPALITSYYRQYGGFTRRKRKLIYVSAFVAPHEKVSPSDADWRTQAVIICDGGEGVFGVEYDVKTGRFQHLVFNGGP